MAAPVGIDEGWTVEQKYNLAVKSIELMKRIGMGTRIAVMSGGRKDDVGRHATVDRTITDALELVDRLNSVDVQIDEPGQNVAARSVDDLRPLREGVSLARDSLDRPVKEKNAVGQQLIRRDENAVYDGFHFLL